MNLFDKYVKNINRKIMTIDDVVKAIYEHVEYKLNEGVDVTDLQFFLDDVEVTDSFSRQVRVKLVEQYGIVCAVTKSSIIKRDCLVFISEIVPENKVSGVLEAIKNENITHHDVYIEMLFG